MRHPGLFAVYCFAMHGVALQAAAARGLAEHQAGSPGNHTWHTLTAHSSMAASCYMGATLCPPEGVWQPFNAGPAAAPVGCQQAGCSNGPAGGLEASAGSADAASTLLEQLAPPPSGGGHPHKPLWPLGLQDALGFPAVAAVLILAASSGIGGGGLLIPTFILVFGFSTTYAVALSNITIVGGTLTNFAFNMWRRHPLRAGQLIDWDLILVMEPSTILGALAGGYINHLLPSWMTTVALSVLLAFVTVNLVRRGLAVHHKETEQLQRLLTELEQGDDSSPKLLDGAGSSSGSLAAAAEGDPTLWQRQEQQQQQRRQQQQQQLNLEAGEDQLQEPLLGAADGESSGDGSSGPAAAAPAPPPALVVQRCRRLPDVPLGKLAILISLLVGVVASDTIRGHLPCPSLRYWLVAVSMAPVTLLVLFGVRTYLMSKHSKRLAAGDFSPVEGDVAWTARTTLLYPALCTFAGLVAGLFGVGGGIVKGPLMLEMGVHPQVAAATSATMILFTSAAASTVFISFGAVQWDYAGVLIAGGLVFTAVGQLATKWVVRRLHGRSSVIVFCMASVLGLSSVVLGVQGAFASRAAFQQHRQWAWGNLCGSAHE